MIIVKPFNDKWTNILEILNEATCFIVCLFMTAFTELSDNTHAKHKAAQICLFIIFANVIANFVLVVKDMISSIKKFHVKCR